MEFLGQIVVLFFEEPLYCFCSGAQELDRVPTLKTLLHLQEVTRLSQRGTLQAQLDIDTRHALSAGKQGLGKAQKLKEPCSLL